MTAKTDIPASDSPIMYAGSYSLSPKDLCDVISRAMTEGKDVYVGKLNPNISKLVGPYQVTGNNIGMALYEVLNGLTTFVNIYQDGEHLSRSIYHCGADRYITYDVMIL